MFRLAVGFRLYLVSHGDYLDNLETMEKKMETTISGLGLVGNQGIEYVSDVYIYIYRNSIPY